MKELNDGWCADVDRGPDCLLVRLHPPAASLGEGSGLADDLWSLLRGHLMRRMVLELDDIDLQSSLVGQLMHLHERVSSEGGMLRLCGLSDENREVLHACHLEGYLPAYQDRREAMMDPRGLVGSGRN